MTGNHQRFARLSDGDLAEIANSMRLQTPDHAASLVIANALEAVVQRRLEVREIRRQANPARAGLLALQRLTCWASGRASLRIDAAMGRPLP